LHVDEQLDAYRDVAALAEEVLAAAAAQGYPKCRFTLDQIRDWEGSRSSKAGEQGTGLTREAAQDT
jgi:hypothetical protein